MERHSCGLRSPKSVSKWMGAFFPFASSALIFSLCAPIFVVFHSALSWALYTVGCRYNKHPELPCAPQLCLFELGPDLDTFAFSLVTRASSKVSMVVVSRHRACQSAPTVRSIRKLWSRCSRVTLYSCYLPLMAPPFILQFAIILWFCTLCTLSVDDLGQHDTDYRSPPAQEIGLIGPKLQILHEHCHARYRMVSFTGTSFQYTQTLSVQISTNMDCVDTIHWSPTNLYKARNEGKQFPSNFCILSFLLQLELISFGVIPSWKTKLCCFHPPAILPSFDMTIAEICMSWTCMGNGSHAILEPYIRTNCFTDYIDWNMLRTSNKMPSDLCWTSVDLLWRHNKYVKLGIPNQ